MAVAFWLVCGCIFIVPFVALQVLSAAGSRSPIRLSEGDVQSATVLALILALLLATAVLVKWFFAFFCVADGAGGAESFARSAELTKGWRAKLFVIAFVLAALSSPAYILLGAAELFKGPVPHLLSSCGFISHDVIGVMIEIRPIAHLLSSCGYILFPVGVLFAGPIAALAFTSILRGRDEATRRVRASCGVVKRRVPLEQRVRDVRSANEKQNGRSGFHTRL
jgi:hypothetical protein